MPCYPLFITRDGFRRYRVTVHPPIALPPRKRGDEQEVAAIWAEVVYRTARRHWNQWFVFEPLVTREPRIR